MTLARLVVASHAGLGDAEAYYWTWSQELATGYYDHGPVVALLIRLGSSVLGDTPLGVRLPFILLSAATMLGLARVTATMLHGSGLWCVLILLAMPVFQVAGGAANPDVPLIACVTFFLLALLRAAAGGTRGLLWIALAGIWAGIAVSCKLFGLALVAPLLWVSWRHPARWAAACSGLVLMALGSLPVLWWNLEHGWASLAYHMAHRHTQPVGPSLVNLVKLVGGQLAYLSPLVLAGLLATLAALWRRRGAVQVAPALLWTALPLLLCGYLLILIVPSAEPHWPVAGYLPLAAYLAVQLPGWYRSRRAVRALAVTGLAFSGLVALALHLHVLTDLGVHLMPRSYHPRYDLSNELRGWSQVAEEVSRKIAGSSVGLVAGCHYTTCSQLAFAARGRFEVACPSPRLDQFDFSPVGDGSSPSRPLDLLYVKDERFPYPASQLYRCRSTRLLSEVRIRRAGRVVRRFDLELCEGYSGLLAQRWPPH